MVPFLMATAVSSFMQANAANRLATAEQRANILQASEARKAEGTATVRNLKQLSENNVVNNRKALSLQGQAQAAADSSNLGGNSVDDLMNSIDIDIGQAIAFADADAEHFRRLNEHANNAKNRSLLFQSNNYQSADFGNILMNVGAAYLGQTESMDGLTEGFTSLFGG